MTGALIGLFLAQMPGMTAMDNSVGFIASGTSIPPRTSEFVPVVHGYLGSWTLMFSREWLARRYTNERAARRSQAVFDQLADADDFPRLWTADDRFADDVEPRGRQR
jgi:hypothetical protein